MIPQVLPVPGVRSGWVGATQVDADYMRAIKKKATRMEKVCRVRRNGSKKKGLVFG